MSTDQQTQQRFEGLEAYRGIAALLVVIYHAYQHSRVDSPRYVFEGTLLHPFFRNLETGVDWFFVLSGFLIFLPFARTAVDQTSVTSVRGFLVRRAIRILPLYYVAILLIWSLRFNGGPGQWLDLFEHLTFTHIFDQAHIFWTIGPAWSLADEVIFYLGVAGCAPLFYSLCRRLATRRARLAALAAGSFALCLASIAYKGWAFWIAQVPESAYPVYFGPLARLDSFTLGMLLAVMLVAVRGLPLLAGRTASFLRLGGAVMLVALFLLRSSVVWLDVYFYTLSGAAFALVLGSTVFDAPASAWNNALARPLFRALGTISYSIYLWHEPIMLELSQRNILLQNVPEAFVPNALILVALSLAAGCISYWAIEYPTMLLRYLFTREGHLAGQYPEEHSTSH